MRVLIGILLAVGLIPAPIRSSSPPVPAPYKCTATGCKERTPNAKMGDIVSVKDFGAPCNGSSDDQPAFAAAIATAPSTGLVIDASSCTGGVVFGSSLTINKPGVKLLLPPAAISLGTHQIVVPVGTHSVALVGPAPHGSSVADPTSTSGARLVYTGTGTAVVVGDTGGAADTYGFLMEDVTIDIVGAGTSAIGLQLNRTIGFTLRRARVGLASTLGTSPIAIDFQGGANYTGGRVDDGWISGGALAAVAYNFGPSANAITITGGHISMGGIGKGTAFNMVCANTFTCTGNTILGGDVENTLTLLALDYAQGNLMIGTRSEATTNAATATAHATNNTQFATSGTQAMTVTDAGTNNSFTDGKWTNFNRNRWLMNGINDATSDIQISSGLTTAQLSRLLLIDNVGAGGWRVQKGTTGTFDIVNHGTAATRLQFGSANTFINGESGTVFFNSSKLGINSGGNVSTYSNVTTAGVGIVPIYGKVALTAQTADLAATSVYASVPVGEYRVCATARTTTSGSGTTATLNIIWNDEGGAKTDAVGTWALNSVAVTGQINKCEYIHATSTSNIQVSVTGGTYGTSAYAISATAERLN